MCCKQYMEWARFLEWHVEMSILLIVTLKVPAIRDCYNLQVHIHVANIT